MNTNHIESRHLLLLLSARSILHFLFGCCRYIQSVHIAVTAAATTAVNTKKLAEICRPFIRQRSRVEKELKSLKEKLKGWRAEFCKDSKVKVEDVNALLENGRANPSFPVSMTISQAVGCIYEDCERLEKLLNVLTAKGSIADADTIITAAVAHDENSRLGANRQANNVSARPVVATLEKARADFVSLQNKGLKLCDEIETMAAALRSDVRHKLDPPDHVIAQILSETDNGIFRPEDEWQYMMHACLFMDEATKRLERVKAGMADFRHLTASITQRDEAMNLSDNDDNEVRTL